MKLLVISDTHFRRPGERLPRKVEEAAAAADFVMHCGDFEALSAYEYLGRFGRVAAVRGNIDEPAVEKILSGASRAGGGLALRCWSGAIFGLFGRSSRRPRGDRDNGRPNEGSRLLKDLARRSQIVFLLSQPPAELEAEPRGLIDFLLSDMGLLHPAGCTS